MRFWAPRTHDAPGPPPRIVRERRTIEAMIAIYCRDHRHQGQRQSESENENESESRSGATLCDDCRELFDYASCRLDRCPFGADKTTCVNCPIHCYKPAMRERVRVVMRYAGPRMLWKHPILAVRHLLDDRRRPPGDGEGPP